MNRSIEHRRYLSKKVRLFRRGSNRLDYAVYGTMEPLERRVHLSSVTINVNGGGDDTGTDTPTPMGSGEYQATTLRDAVNFADSEFAGNSAFSFTITFTSSVSGTISLLHSNGGELDIKASNSLIEKGPNAIAISGSNTSSVFNVYSGVNVTISDLTVTDGNANADSGSGRGGAIFNGGGTLTLSSVTVSSSIATEGGGIDNASGTLSMTNCTIDGDSASSDGGGLYNAGYVTATGCTVGMVGSNDTAVKGGGIFNNTTTTLSLTTCTITGDSTTGTGNGAGAIYNDSGFLKMNGGSIVDCNADGSGGGIINNSTASLTLVAVNGDSSLGQNAGAIFNTSTGTLSLINDTFENCSADYNGGAIFNFTNGTVIMTGGSVVDCNAGDGFGGGLKNDGTATVGDVTFDGDSCYGAGGAIGSMGVLDANGDNFYYCTATRIDGGGNGGGVRDDGTGYLNHCTITNCSAIFNGGGVSVYSIDFTIENSNISNDHVTGNNPHHYADFGGGGVYAMADRETMADLGTIEIVGSKIENDAVTMPDSPVNSYAGGGIYATAHASSYASSVIIQGDTLANDQASFGGGIRTDFGSEPRLYVHIYNTTITECYASEGGGIQDNGGDHLFIDYSQITNCDAYGFGGAR